LLANRVGVLHEGNLLQIDSRENVFLRPRTECVAEIVGNNNRLAGVVETADGEHITIRINEARLQAEGSFAVGTKVVACIRPEQVSLALDHFEAPGLNRLDSRVVAVSTSIIHQRITLRCSGFEVIALVNRNASSDLAISEGAEVAALFSPTAVHVIRQEDLIPTKRSGRVIAHL
jgi:ABC-type Fe3+/spermidine/putrescine transport system ATPase subunit